MICPRCGKEIQLSDDSRFCSGCGLEFQRQTAPIVQQPIQQTAIEEPKEQTIQQIAAQKELVTLNKVEKNTSANGMIGLLLVVAFVCLICGAFPITILLVIIAIIMGVDKSKRKNRMDMLSHISAGQQIVNVCPKCKSPDIEMSMVQTGGFTTHGTTRVADNINPLHPFTHTNVKKGNDYTSYSYGNQCHCRNCGFVFAKPEVHYI